MKRYIAKNEIQFYTVNAVSIAKGLGLGGRFNMVMQSAFFKLANIIPIETAVTYLKEAVVTSYGRKGQNIVDMNNGAIDQGIEALHKVEVSASWADAEDAPEEKRDLPEFITEVQEVMNRQEGDKLPVSKDVYKRQEVAIDVDREKMAAYKLTLAKIAAAIKDENQLVPSGSVYTETTKSDVRVVAQFQKPSDIEKVQDVYKRQRLSLSKLTAMRQPSREARSPPACWKGSTEPSRRKPL